jgi:hypothetical protein
LGQGWSVNRKTQVLEKELVYTVCLRLMIYRFDPKDAQAAGEQVEAGTWGSYANQ